MPDRALVLGHIAAHPGCTAVDLLAAGHAPDGTITLIPVLRDLEASGAITRYSDVWAEHVTLYPKAHLLVYSTLVDQAARWRTR